MVAESKDRSPFLTVCMNGGLITACALAGWVWVTVISTQGDKVWFFIATFCGVLLGISIHQLMTKGRWFLTGLCLAAFVGSTMTAHWQGLSRQKPLTTQPREPVFVKTERISAQAFTEQFTFSGIIKPERSALLAFAGAGLIEELHVDENDTVQTGQVLAQLNANQLLAGLEEAKAVCVRTASNRKRLEKLLTENATSEMHRDDAIAENEVAKARIKALEAGLEDMTLKAPFAGRIALRFVEEGEFASPGKPIFKLLLLDPVKVVIGVPEKMIGLIRHNAPTTVILDALDATNSFKGQVTLISPETSGDSPLYAVEITVPNAAGRLKPGMAARTLIQGSTYENATHLKTSWVQRTGGQHVIFQVVPLEEARHDFMALNALSPEQLQAIVDLLANPADIGVARQVVLKDFIIRDGDYVVRDPLPDYPVVTRGTYLLEDLSVVRTGILKHSEDVIDNNGAAE
ncbi:MAG: efflux RND transporter periplasmic adaptor subunit [Phycisphaerae bacterium]|nr:efflux RND transporter periplasmic adaptor subunit [Phycisphaerae bacterium]